MRRAALLSLALILALILIILLLGYNNYGQSPEHELPLPKGTVVQVVGEPAIKPTLNGVPAFTKHDVVLYIKSRPMLFTDAPGSSITITEADVTFMTSKQVNAIINRQGLGIPDNYPLCFAQLLGNFPFPGPSTDNGKPVTVTYRYAYEVFDAKTGNLLMGGGLNITPTPGPVLQ
ncbi:hypothetical protein KSF_002150 [Reticulibacter mediterranei]|uniref:Uncharacterized protein n=1 Tax=Reticulibacter mediterranei TaxID=2778369 RepID=A0A8J3N0E1_9CHLR|nr:hypothetical protein [Reticulibacter mediterranei]GHO90167.1 hypothetical protein KSF_002150 [Reticulibacter mediterranei]